MGKRLLMRTHNHAKRTLGRLIKEFYEDPKADIAKFRAMVYAMSVLLSYFHLEVDSDFEERLTRLEEMLETGQISRYREAGL